MPYTHKCTVCSSNFKSNQPHTKYCSSLCRNQHYIKITGRYAYDNMIASGTVGAISELMVSSDLMKKGFAVFRALSPNCICDLIAIKNGGFFRVEVTTGYKSQKNKISHAKKKSKSDGRCDIIAIYIRNTNEVSYEATTSTEVKPGVEVLFE